MYPTRALTLNTPAVPMLRDLECLLSQAVEDLIGRPVARVLDPRVRARIDATLREDEAGVSLTVDLPGYRPEQLEVSSEGRTLIVRARASEDGDRPAFERRLTMPPVYDLAAATATLTHGVLSIRLPKAPDAQPRTVPITTS